MSLSDQIEKDAAEKARDAERKRCAGIVRMASKFSANDAAKNALDAAAAAIENDDL